MTDSPTPFADLGLTAEVLAAVEAVGYEAPSPIQEAAIPVLLDGSDLVGQAQTGTGKTAAFALPILSRLDVRLASPQALVLTPTRELAIQVAEAMQTYAGHLQGFHVLPVYGGQGYRTQLRQLKRGVHAVVGTPGRILDHLRRGTLALADLRFVVLDEADEMLRMGFLDDVEEILRQTPAEKQVALFSATLPPAIVRVADAHLRDPVRIRIEARTATVETVRQRYWRVRGIDKLDALTRILEVEEFEAMLVFVRTKVATAELAQRLEARGFACAGLHGDMSQGDRERTVERLRNGDLDIVVATDVAARGLDVDRITHVVNFDIPYDAEAYIHRIGRTGRAGREGQAILFVSHREQRMLRAIERATRQTIEPMRLPSRQDVTDRRIEELGDSIREVLENVDLGPYEEIAAGFRRSHEVDPGRLAGAVVYLLQKERPLLPDPAGTPAEDRALRGPDAFEGRPARGERSPASRGGRGASGSPVPAGGDLAGYKIQVGRRNGVEIRNIVGAIGSEAGLHGSQIGRVRIFEEWSLVELPAGLPDDVLEHLGQVWVCGRQLRITPDDGPPQKRRPGRRGFGNRPGRKPRR